jgi:hypothetical protein
MKRDDGAMRAARAGALRVDSGAGAALQWGPG